MSEDEILLGIALTVVLAVGSQILASRLRVPTPAARPDDTLVLLEPDPAQAG